MNPAGTTEVAELVKFLKLRANRQEFVTVKCQRMLGNQPPWQAVGLTVQRGQAYSLFADGLIYWSRRYPHLHGGPSFHLWARINPCGRAVNLTSNSGTFVADTAGELELGIYMGMWADEFGTLKSLDDLYRPLAGGLDVAVVLYHSEPLKSLERLCQQSRTPVAIVTEAARLRSPDKTPGGWHYLHEAGYATIYEQQETPGGHIVHAHANNEQGILRHPIDFPLTPTTNLQWRWRVEEHPSIDPENQAISHDYISLATEFDNGRDLTWVWSSCLKPGTFFQCPIKTWQDRETHYVIRSHNDSLGKWYTETRNVYDDVTKTMGPPPERITAIWLIVLSTFHHRIARAAFTGIKIVDKEFEIAVT